LFSWTLSTSFDFGSWNFLSLAFLRLMVLGRKKRAEYYQVFAQPSRNIGENPQIHHLL
jgi:hypothetical protein